MPMPNDAVNEQETVDARLEGGPGDLPESLRLQRVAANEEKIKIVHRGGYEHFQRTGQVATRPSDAPVVFRWSTRTRMAE